MSACENYQSRNKFFETVDPSHIKIIKHEVQYDFFLTPIESETEMLVREMDGVKISVTKIRKALFARNGDLQRKMLELEERLNIVERGICRGVFPDD
jgi:hypothetical protein